MFGGVEILSWECFQTAGVRCLSRTLLVDQYSDTGLLQKYRTLCTTHTSREAHFPSHDSSSGIWINDSTSIHSSIRFFHPILQPFWAYLATKVKANHLQRVSCIYIRRIIESSATPPLVAGSLTWLALGSLCSLFKFLVVKNLNVKDRILCICCGTLCAANAVIPLITCTKHSR